MQDMLSLTLTHTHTTEIRMSRTRPPCKEGSTVSWSGKKSNWSHQGRNICGET